ncbi:excalibur calcium-binding domain-containing protein [uncultured Tateyamaria sp.]|uniref:excalibur calcium-binding domain-containing protein n=1 Tax=uncultured Tateyamaria sp. TaxID=455651 RepID=UPI0026350C3D|nr:excalibur calcium-binding domain-containing protein [uncultured Tateyamaria sp.]
MRAFVLIVFAALAACSADILSPDALSQKVATAPTTELCSAYFLDRTTARGKLMIEAELAVRGVRQCSRGNYGQRSLSTFGSTAYNRSTSASQSLGALDRDCADFSSDAAAQKFFLAEGGPTSDPHDLDRDGDGLACEWGTQVRRIAAYQKPAPTYRRPAPVRRVPVYRSRCYTGPRGGTYTITASGAKNYNGC